MERFDIELTQYLQVENYIAGPKASSANASTKVIIQNKKEENRERRTRLIEQLNQAVIASDVYILGQKPQIKAAAPSTLLDGVINYLVTNTYNKLTLLKHRQADAWAEIKAVLNSQSHTQTSLGLIGAEANPEALTEVRSYLGFAASNQRVLLSDIIKRFAAMPYGWKPESEIVLIIARLFMAGEIKLTFEGSDLESRSAADPLTKPAKFSNVAILKRKSADAEALRKAKELYKELFKKITADEEDTIVSDYRTQFKVWLEVASTLLNRASLQYYPGKETLQNAITKIKQQLNIRDSFEFVEHVIQDKNNWLDFAGDIDDIQHFYTSQLGVWTSMLEALKLAEENHTELENVPEAQLAIQALKEIRSNATPWGLVQKITPLVEVVKQQNTNVITHAYDSAKTGIEKAIHEVKQNLAQYHASADISNRVLMPLQQHLQKLEIITNVARIRLSIEDAHSLADHAIAEIGEATKPKSTATSTSVPLSNTGATTPATTIVTPAAPTVEKPVVVTAAKFSSKLYLENEAEVEDYINKLKAELLGVVKTGKKVRVQ